MIGGRLARVAPVACVAALLVLVLTSVVGLASSGYSSLIHFTAPNSFIPGEGSGVDTVTSGACSFINGGESWAGVTLVTGGAASLHGVNFAADGCRESGLSIGGGGTTYSMGVAFQDDGTNIGGTEFLYGGQESATAWGIGINWGAGSNDVDFYDFTHQTDCTATSGGSIVVGDSHPHFIVVTVSATNGTRLYYDGLLCTSLGSYADSMTTCAVTLGAMVAGNCTSTSGCISHCVSAHADIGEGFLFGSRELTAAQVAAEYAAATSGLPPVGLSVNPAFAYVITGHSDLFTFQAIDSTGTASSPGTVTLTGTAPAGGLGSCSVGGGGLVCVAGPTGTYTATWTNGTLTATSRVFVTGATASFAVAPARCATTVSGVCNFHNVSADLTGSNTSPLDGFSATTVPSGVTCRDPVQGASYQTVGCSDATIGEYTITFTDAAGLTATATLVVGAAVNPSACGSTDLGCWLSTLAQAVFSIPATIAEAIYGMLFVSSSGKSFVDVASLTNALVPNIACRSGQAPTAVDGVHCYPFPFSLPFDLEVIAAQIFGQSPVVPTFTMRIYAPPYIDVSHTVDVSVFLNTDFMTKYRDAELVIFALGVVYETHKITELVHKVLDI